MTISRLEDSRYRPTLSDCKRSNANEIFESEDIVEIIDSFLELKDSQRLSLVNTTASQLNKKPNTWFFRIWRDLYNEQCNEIRDYACCNDILTNIVRLEPYNEDKFKDLFSQNYEKIRDYYLEHSLETTIKTLNNANLRGEIFGTKFYDEISQYNLRLFSMCFKSFIGIGMQQVARFMMIESIENSSDKTFLYLMTAFTFFMTHLLNPKKDQILKIALSSEIYNFFCFPSLSLVYFLENKVSDNDTILLQIKDPLSSIYSIKPICIHFFAIFLYLTYCNGCFQTANRYYTQRIFGRIFTDANKIFNKMKHTITNYKQKVLKVYNRCFHHTSNSGK